MRSLEALKLDQNQSVSSQSTSEISMYSEIQEIPHDEFEIHNTAVRSENSNFIMICKKLVNKLIRDW
jgi:hypothetical protein